MKGQAMSHKKTKGNPANEANAELEYIAERFAKLEKYHPREGRSISRWVTCTVQEILIESANNASGRKNAEAELERIKPALEVWVRERKKHQKHLDGDESEYELAASALADAICTASSTRNKP